MQAAERSTTMALNFPTAPNFPDRPLCPMIHRSAIRSACVPFLTDATSHQRPALLRILHRWRLTVTAYSMPVLQYMIAAAFGKHRSGVAMSRIHITGHRRQLMQILQCAFRAAAPAMERQYGFAFDLRCCRQHVGNSPMTGISE